MATGLSLGRRVRFGLVVLIVLGGVLIWLVSSSGEIVRPPWVEPSAIKAADARAFTAAHHECVVKLYRQAATQQEGNLVFSPYSLASCLAMLSAGARGQTAAEINGVLALPDGAHWLHDGFQNAQYHLRQTGDDCVLAATNRVWVQRDAPIHPEFLATLRQRYGAGAESLDFVGDPEKSRLKINAWIARQTAGRLTDVLERQALNDQTRVVLTNAVYFNGFWQEEFEEYKTKSLPFHLSTDRQIRCSTMQAQETYQYGDFGDVHALALPYKDGHLSMVVLLPKEVEGLAALEAQLTGANLTQWCSELQEQWVDLHLPKFELRCDLSAVKILKDLGMQRAFTEQADLTGISNVRPGLFVGDVLHAGWIKVHEKGTEAAAATAICEKALCAPASTSFHVDHPFIFLIRDGRTGVVLFIGKVTNPAAGV